MSRELKELHPYVQQKAEKLISECAAAGINILVTQTYRSIAEQDALYAQGRTKPGKKVTNAKGGQSYHNYRLAFDIVPLVNGKPAWDRLDLFDKAGEIGKRIGLEWGGDFKTIKDRPHFQYTQGLTYYDLQNGRVIKVSEEKKQEPHWAEKHFESLKAKGIQISEKRFDDKITRGELFAMLDRIVK